MARLKSPAQFGAEFSQAFADRFGMRSALIVLQHWALVDIFGVSPVWNVMIGRDGWLIWLGEDGQSLDRHYRGVRVVPDVEADAYVAEVKRRNEYLRARGIAYLTVIVPEKFTIYPEYLPTWVAQAPNPRLLARTMDRLAKDGTVPYVDLRPLLREAKGTTGPEPLYYQTDTHWNLAGAGVGYTGDHAQGAGAAAGPHPVDRPAGAPILRRLAGISTGAISRESWGFRSASGNPTICRLAKSGGIPRSVGLRARLMTPDKDSFKDLRAA